MFPKQVFLIILTIISLIPALAGAQSPSVTDAAERRAREFVGLAASGNRSEYRRYVESSFNDELLKMPLERHLSFLSSLHDQSRGYEVTGVQDSKGNEVTLLLKNKLTGEFEAIAVAVEQSTPFKISAVNQRSPRLPAVNRGPLSNKEVAAEVESFVKKLAGADVFSGAVLIAKDGEILYKGAFGEANKDFHVPNRVDTKFNLGSMNKMFTAVAIAQLVESGKLSFDDPLSKYIPDFPNEEAAKKIKIKHLLTHTAGLGGFFTRRYQDMSRARLRTIDDMMTLARQDEKDLLFEPGSKWQYSNTGMMVLGKVIEIVSGRTYYDYVRDNIYRPAGMANTDCYELDKINSNLAVGYEKQYTDDGIRWSNNIFEHVMRGGPQGGGYSTVEDLLKFDQALRSGKLLGPEYVKTITSAKPELNSPNYGYGFQVTNDGLSTGHSGGFIGISSNLSMQFGSGWTAIVMSNYGRSAMNVIQKMNRLIASSSASKQARR